MAGQPKLRALLEALQRRKARDEQPELDDLEYVAQCVEGGETMLDICRELKEACGFAPTDISDDKLRRYLKAKYGDRFTERMDPAKREGASSKVEEAQRIVDDARETTEGIRKAESRAKTRQWEAERANREKFGGSPKMQVNLAVGSYHLDALRKRVRPPAEMAQLVEKASEASEQPESGS